METARPELLLVKGMAHLRFRFCLLEIPPMLLMPKKLMLREQLVNFSDLWRPLQECQDRGRSRCWSSCRCQNTTGSEKAFQLWNNFAHSIFSRTSTHNSYLRSSNGNSLLQCATICPHMEWNLPHGIDTTILLHDPAPESFANNSIQERVLHGIDSDPFLQGRVFLIFGASMERCFGEGLGCASSMGMALMEWLL